LLNGALAALVELDERFAEQLLELIGQRFASCVHVYNAMLLI
jgi:hypothetical protein